jgi:hypothetical protein
MSRLLTTIVQLILLVVSARLVYLVIQDLKENGLN